jgi:hypothetical protein
LPFTSKKLRVQLTTDPAMAFMFGVAALLTLALPIVTEVAARTHNFMILKDLLLVIGVFALVGIAFGILRSIRMTRAVKNKI